MWVLDSGMKSLNSDGIVKINSIITDITQLKNIESELKLEESDIVLLCKILQISCLSMILKTIPL